MKKGVYDMSNVYANNKKDNIFFMSSSNEFNSTNVKNKISYNLTETCVKRLVNQVNGMVSTLSKTFTQEK